MSSVEKKAEPRQQRKPIGDGKRGRAMTQEQQARGRRSDERMGHTLRILALSLALQQGGCAAYYAAQRGDEAMARRDFDSAVNEYREATQRKPGKAEYQQKLQTAREARVAMWLGEAAQLGNSGDLNRALQRCELALTDLPEHTGARTLHSKLSEHRAQATAQLEAAKAALLARRDLQTAATTLQGLLPLAPTFPELPVFVQQANDMLRSQQLDAQGQGQLQEQQHEAALNSLTEAVRLDSGNQAAQAHLGTARESFSAVLDKTAKDALAARKYSVAVPALSRAADLWSTTGNPADAARSEPFRQRGSDVLFMLIKRERLAAERAEKPRLLGLSWAHYKSALLLQNQALTLRGSRGDAQAMAAGTATLLTPDVLPILEPLLRYPVSLRIEGEPLLVDRMSPMLRSALSPFSQTQRVDFVSGDAEDARTLAQIALRLGNPSLTTQPGRVETRTQSYVARIDMVPNPHFRQLVVRSDELSLALQQLDGSVAVASQNASQATRHEHRLARAEQQARATQADAERRYREAEAHADEVQRRVSRLQRQLSDAEYELAQLESRIAATRDPQQRQPLEAQRARLRSHLHSLRTDLQDARHQRERAVATVDQLRLQRGSDRSVREIDSAHDDAERNARRAQADLANVASDRDRVAAELAHTRHLLSQTPELIEQPVHADYAYSEQFFRRIARVDASLRMTERALPAPLVEKPVWADAWHEDFARSEHRVPGAPDLYIAPHPPRFPLDEDLVGRALSTLAKDVKGQLSGALSGHGARFLRQAAASTGDARLNALLLAHHAGSQIADKAALQNAQQEIARALGLDVTADRVNLAIFDGQ